MKTIRIGLVTFSVLTLCAGPAWSWGHANSFGGGSFHEEGFTSHENTWGGETSHAFGEGTTHTSAWGSSTSREYGEGTTHTNVYGGSATHYEGGGWSKTGAYGGTAYGAQFLGTTDAVSLTFKVSDTVVLRLAPGANGGAPNVIGGYAGNVTQ